MRASGKTPELQKGRDTTHRARGDKLPGHANHRMPTARRALFNNRYRLLLEALNEHHDAHGIWSEELRGW